MSGKPGRSGRKPIGERPMTQTEMNRRWRRRRWAAISYPWAGDLTRLEDCCPGQHLIPRRSGDVPDPWGGVRAIIGPRQARSVRQRRQDAVAEPGSDQSAEFGCDKPKRQSGRKGSPGHGRASESGYRVAQDESGRISDVGRVPAQPANSRTGLRKIPPSVPVRPDSRPITAPITSTGTSGACPFVSRGLCAERTSFGSGNEQHHADRHL